MRRDWLIIYRTKKKLTQKEVADKANLSMSSYASYEIGCRLPSVKNAKKVAKILSFDWRKFYENE